MHKMPRTVDVDIAEYNYLIGNSVNRRHGK